MAPHLLTGLSKAPSFAGKETAFTMLTIVELAVAAVFVAMVSRDTPVGAWLQSALIEAPAAWLSGLTVRQVVLAVLLVVALGALLPAMPVELAFAAAGDMAGYMELVTVLAAAAAAVRSRALWREARSAAGGLLRSAVQRVRRCVAARPAVRRARRNRPAQRPPSSDEGRGEHGGWALA